jgi:uncharacterized protein
VDPEMDVDETELAAMQDQISEYIHNLRRVVQTRGTKMNLLSTTVAGFGPNAQAIIDLICGTKGIPQRVLLGSERGELASTQDRDNWGDRINEYRKMHADPVTRILVDRFIEHGALPAPKGVDNDSITPRGKYKYVVSWPQVSALDSAKTAEVISKLAGANQQNAQAGGGLLFTADELRYHTVRLGRRPAEAKVPYGKPLPGQVQAGTGDTPADEPATNEGATDEA